MSRREVKVSIEHLGYAIREALDETKELTDDAVCASVVKTTREVITRTKSASPVKTGKYKRGWSSKVTRFSKRGGYGKTVFNKPRYQLTHLLQHGHGGPRPAGAHPHIPSDEETENIFVKNLKREMQKQ